MTVRRLVGAVAAVALASFVLIVFTLAGTASADDCSSPPDCSNTAWTVGGAAAAAAAVAAAAAATGWLPGQPKAKGKDFKDPGCKQQLESLLALVKQANLEVAQLVTTREGAQRKARRAAAEASLITAKAEGMSSQLDIAGTFQAGVSTGTLGADSFGTGTALGVAGAEASAEGWSTLARTGAQKVNELKRAPWFAKKLVEARLTKLKTLTKFLEESAESASFKAGILGAAGNAAGVVSLATTGYDQWASLERDPKLHALGEVIGDAEVKAMEAQRWLSFQEELTGRIKDADQALKRAVDNYNFNAARCGAETIVKPSLDDMMSRMAPAAAGQASVAPGSETAPPVVLPSEPKVDDRTTMPSDCDHSAYLRDYLHFPILDGDRRTSSHEMHRWEQRQADLEASISAVDDTLMRAELYFADCRTNAQIFGTLGAGATVFGFMVSAPAAIVLGITSVYCDIKGGAAAPPDAVGIEIGIMRQRLQFLKSRRAYVESERARLHMATLTHRSNIRDSVDRLKFMYSKCAGKDQSYWPEPPEVPDDPVEPVVFPQPRPYTEIGTWR
jgi:hypothetical protein